MDHRFSCYLAAFFWIYKIRVHKNNKEKTTEGKTEDEINPG